MKPNVLKAVAPLETAGCIRPGVSGKSHPYFYGTKMLGLPATREAVSRVTAQKIRQITNNMYFYNRVAVRISLDYRAGGRTYGAALRGYEPDVKDFARELIDGALRREVDSEIAIMARGENIAANQRRQKILGQYLLSKPYQVIRNFYGVRMQKLAANPPSEARRDGTDFYSDIVHERVGKTVYSPVQTQTERVSATPEPSVIIRDGDLDRIAAQAAMKVEKKMRTQRERNGKW